MLSLPPSICFWRFSFLISSVFGIAYVKYLDESEVDILQFDLFLHDSLLDEMVVDCRRLCNACCSCESCPQQIKLSGVPINLRKFEFDECHDTQST